MKNNHQDVSMSFFSGMPNISGMMPTLSSLPQSAMQQITLQRMLNIYSSYKYGGKNAAFAMGATSLADGVLAHNGINKNYFSLAAFWGSIAYQGIQQISQFEIPQKYKIPAQIACAGVGTLLALKGKDIFENKHNVQETSNKILLAAKIFDEDNAIKRIEDSFKEGYSTGARSVFNNLNSLLSNKFIYTALGKQMVDALHLIVFNKFLNDTISLNKLNIFNSHKNGEAVNFVMKAIAVSIARNLIEIIHNKISENINSESKRYLDKKMTELFLNEDNSSKIMHIGPDKMDSFSDNVVQITNDANMESASIIREVVLPHLYSNKVEKNVNFTETIQQHPLLVLCNSTCRQLLSGSNIAELSKYIFGQDNLKVSVLEYDLVTRKKHGVMQIFQNTPEKFVHYNIQEIITLGGNDYMRSQVEQYFRKQSDTFMFNNNMIHTTNLLQIISGQLGDLLFAILLNHYKIQSQDEIMLLEQSLGAISQYIDPINTGSITFNSVQVNPSEVSKIYNILIDDDFSINAERHLSKNHVLKLNNYELKMLGRTTLLEIDDLEFQAGNIYAIHGKNGAGKSVLITDIAKCLANTFESKGEISYPANSGKELKKIFCGDSPFISPKATLFDLLTYRLPKECSEERKQELGELGRNLLKDFGQERFIEEVGNNPVAATSKGQGNMISFISAILYKQYLGDQPVLFMIDETFTGIASDVINLIQVKIKEYFKDSIVIAVDHEYEKYLSSKAEPNKVFYNQDVKIDDFIPQIDDINPHIDLAGGQASEEGDIVIG